MSQGMLGHLSLSDTQGPRKDLEDKLAGPEGSVWLQALNRFLRKEDPWVAKVSASASLQEEWSEFYHKFFRVQSPYNYFAFSADFTEVQIPEYQDGFCRALLIPDGLTINTVIKAMRKHFKVLPYTTDLDQDVSESERDRQASYAISIHNRVEADEELQNLSANQLKEQGINSLTLLERLVYELKYYSETGKHLDLVKVTLCAGSRSRVGGVPRVYWYYDQLLVDSCYPSYSHHGLRARQVIS